MSPSDAPASASGRRDVLTRHCARRFAAHVGGATSSPYEVVLADNGSVDGAPEQAATRPEVTLRPTGSNLGYGGAANVGARGATGEWLIVVNPDVQFERGGRGRAARRGDAVAQRWGIRAGDQDRVRRPLPVGALDPVGRPRGRPRPAGMVVAVEPVDERLPARAGPAGGGRDRLAVRVVPAAAAGGRSSRSGASIPATSCTSRTSTCASGSAVPVGSRCTCRRR